MQPRNDFADSLKGALIFLVACGLLIQHVGCQGDARYSVDPLFKAVFTFHMPLFMAVSGYVSFRAIARTSLFHCAWRRGREVIISAVCWPLLYLLVTLSIFILKAGTVTDGWHAFRLFLVAAIFAAGLGCCLMWTTDTYVYRTRMWLALANLPNEHRAAVFCGCGGLRDIPAAAVVDLPTGEIAPAFQLGPAEQCCLPHVPSRFVDNFERYRRY